MHGDHETRLIEARIAARGLADDALERAARWRLEAARRNRETAIALEIEALVFTEERARRRLGSRGNDNGLSRDGEGARAGSASVGLTSGARPAPTGHASPDGSAIARGRSARASVEPGSLPGLARASSPPSDATAEGDDAENATEQASIARRT